MQETRDEVCREYLDFGIEITNIAVVESAGSLDFIFGVSQVSLKA